MAFGSPLSRRDLLKGLGLGALSMAAAGPAFAAAPGKRKPNVVIIYADDMGWGDVGCYGCEDIPTPHLDALAANGVRFTDGYVSCPQCAPSRAGLMTGKYQQRFGFEWNPPMPRCFDDGLPLTETCIATQMKQAGYATGIVGKWHLGAGDPLHPNQRGFDEFFGTLHGSSLYFPPYNWAARYYKDREMPAFDTQRNGEAVDEQAYLTDAFTREAAAFIDRHHDEPFFLYVPYTAPHTPLQPTEDRLERVKDIADETRRQYAAMVVSLDDGVGRIMAALREHGIESDTLVFFICDNGATTNNSAGSNGPLKAGKGSVYEGGVRVPFIAQWPGVLPEGATYSEPVMQLDAAATAVALAGGDISGMDGVDLTPFLTGDRSGAPHDTLYWRFCNFGYARHGKPWQWAVRRGDWKLCRAGAEVELFNLAEDLGETTNVIADHPEKADELRQAYREWAATLEYPRWPEDMERVPWDPEKAGVRGVGNE